MSETKVAIWGCLAFSDDCIILNHRLNREVKPYNDKRGNLLFYHPDLKENKRLDYAMAVLFLNGGKEFENMSEYFVEHIDGNPGNCKLSNLKLITDKEEVFQRRFGYLKNKREPSPTRGVKRVYIYDSYTMEIMSLRVSEAAEKFDLGRNYILARAEKGTYLLPDSTRYTIFESYLDAWASD